VEPATLIICNHISQHSDGTIHHKNIQKNIKKNYRMAWDLMVQRGLVERQLLDSILSHRVEASHIPTVVHMMLKYGLIIKLELQGHLGLGNSSLPVPTPEKYLVPALLPTVGNPCDYQDSIWKHFQTFKSCYFVFSTMSVFSSAIKSSTLKSYGFLPRGLMERLIGKAVRWSQLTRISSVDETQQLYQNYVILSYGRQWFRLVCLPEINCIRLDIEGEHPIPVHDRINEQIERRNG